MRKEPRTFVTAPLITLAIGLSACVTSQTEPAGATVTPAPASIPSPTQALTPSRAPAPDTAYLPILNALFAEETFRAELKERLGLGDEQVIRLRAVAREETSSLRGAADERSATAALTRARERITAIIGARSTARLYALARERWSDDVRGANGREDPPPGVTPVAATTPGAAAPNAVPGDTRIVINAPAYRMDVFDNGKLVKSYQIGIGYPEFPLPAGIRTANAIIFNPTWTPPNEPWVESPTSKVRVGRKVAAGSGLNPLGLVKVPIGSPSLIHGGKLPAKLGGFASHGCVGLTNAQVIDLSKRLARLGGVEVTDDQIAKYRRKRTETKNIALRQPIPVELRYETIVVEDGKLYIYRDVYGRGTNTEENLRNVLGVYGVALENLSESERAQAMAALDQMGRNARGEKVPAAALTPYADDAGGISLTAISSKLQKAGSTSGRLTRRIKGEKEMVIEIATLAGKGYSAPVELDTGKGDSHAAARKQSY